LKSFREVGEKFVIGLKNYREELGREDVQKSVSKRKNNFNFDT